jgi:hypothetical protein
MSSQPSAVSTTANATVATPPQHWPERAASGKRTIQADAGVDVAIASRASFVASCSRWPPPIVPACASAVTIIHAPGSRGTEPVPCAIATTTARPGAGERLRERGANALMRSPARRCMSSTAHRMRSSVAGASSAAA